MKSRNILLSIVLLTSILMTTLVYSAYNTRLNIEGEAIVRSDQYIRITNITVTETTSGAHETYNNKYNKDVTFMYATLPANSSITYTVEITNKNTISYLIQSITQESHTNQNISIDISLNVNDIVNANNTKTFTIKLTNNTNTTQEETLVYKYGFQLNQFTVTFNPDGGTVSPTSKQVSYSSTYENLPTPTKPGYTFKGWSLLPNGYQQVEYIETDGSQYIDTEYAITSNKIAFDTEFSFASFEIETDLVGNYTNDKRIVFGIWKKSEVETVGFLYDGNSNNNSLTASLDLNQKYHIYAYEDGIKKYLIYDGIKTQEIKSINNQVFGSNNLILLAQGPTLSYRFKGKIYYFKIYDNDTLVRDYIPCINISSNEVGLYDLVNKEFYGKTAGNNFNYGENKYVTQDAQVLTIGNHTLTAIWEPAQYNVTFNPNGGTVSPTSKQVTYLSTYGELPTPTRAGYEFVGWELEDNVLPSEYQQVEYIKSNGTQYIDTEYYWQHENIEINFEGKVNSNPSYQSLFGNEENTKATGDNRNFAGIPHCTNYNCSMYIGNGPQHGFSIPAQEKFLLNIRTTNQKMLYIKIDESLLYSQQYGGTVLTKQNTYISGNTSTTIGNIFIFANHNSSRGWSDAAIQKISEMELYKFQLIDNDAIVRNYIPCYRKTDQKPGLYDTVEGKFYINEESGNDFEVGADIYITNRSTVTKPSNHTLKAKWVTVMTNNVVDYDYTGGSQEFIAPYSGTYQIELWGAQGGSLDDSISYGGYTKGTIDLKINTTKYIQVGGSGDIKKGNSPVPGGYNGGGTGGYGQDDINRYWGSGGGATDIRLTKGNWNNFESLKSRIMVAAAGGGAYAQGQGIFIGGEGGGLSGYKGIAQNSAYGTAGYGATQTEPGYYICDETTCSAYQGGITFDNKGVGGFGYGGSISIINMHSSGGSGYYGGGASMHVGSGGGGSSFISGYSGCDAIDENSTENNIIHTGQPNHYSGKVFTNGVMIDGKGCNWSTGSATNCGTNQPQPDGTYAIGHTGNGYARITFLG